MDQEVIDAVRSYIGKLIKAGYPIKSAVLFGSRARGDWLVTSDVDLLVIIPNTQQGFIERIVEFSRFWDGPWALDVFPYTIDEVRRLLNRGSVALYDALDYGLVIHDDGTFQRLRELFRDAVNRGVIRRVNGWWTIPTEPIYP